MASLAIKISTDKAIKTLEDRIKTAEVANKEWESLEKAHEVALSKHRTEMLKFVTKNGKPTGIARRWYGGGEVEVTFKLNDGVVLPEKPDEPKRPENMLSVYTLNELKQTVRVLKLSDEPTVNANVMKKFADYL